MVPYSKAWAATVALVVLILSLGAAAASAQAPVAAELSAADRDDIAKIEIYLNRISTLQSRFLQVTSNGDYSEGQLYISRPGRMRIEYDPPVPILVVTSGTWLIYHEKKLGQVSHIWLDSTPAGILLEKKITLSGKLTVSGFERGAGAIRLTLVRTEDPHEGSLTLVFGDHPLVLKKWKIIDAQGITTTVSLLDTRFGIPLDPELFKFKDPNIFPDSD